MSAQPGRFRQRLAAWLLRPHIAEAARAWQPSGQMICPDCQQQVLVRISDAAGQPAWKCPQCGTRARKPEMNETSIARYDTGEIGAWRRFYFAQHPEMYRPRIPQKRPRAAGPVLTDEQIQVALSPDFKPVRLPRLTDAQRVQAWEKMGKLGDLNETTQDAWLNSNIAEIEVFGLPERSEDDWKQVRDFGLTEEDMKPPLSGNLPTLSREAVRTQRALEQMLPAFREEREQGQ